MIYSTGDLAGDIVGTLLGMMIIAAWVRALVLLSDGLMKEESNWDGTHYGPEVYRAPPALPHDHEHIPSLDNFALTSGWRGRNTQQTAKRHQLR